MVIKIPVIPGNKMATMGEIQVNVGDKVVTGDVLAQVETGKGNRPIKATSAGVVSKIFYEVGSQIAANAEIFEIDEILETQEEGASKDGTSEIRASKKNASQEINTDLLIIGAGPGGYVAAIYAAKNGLKVTLVEKAALGGTCLNVGCIPTKALVKSSEISKNVRNASDFGVQIDGNISVDMKQVIDRKDQVKDRLVSGVDFLMKKNKINVISGQASFIDENTVAVNEHEIHGAGNLEDKNHGAKNYIVRAKDIIIATGSKISKTNIPGIDLPVVMDSTSALSSTDLPKSITIIGGGVIGMEFAFIYKNFGVEVHVIEFMDRLLTMVDSDISKEIQSIARREKIKVHTDSKVTKIQKSVDGQAVISYEDKKGEHLLVSDKVLVAIGREPNIEGLALENSGVLLNDNSRGIKVNASMATNIKHIYAIGDVTDKIQLAHVASHQGMVAVDNILNKDKKMDYSAVPNVIFTAPEIASVGIGEDEAKSKGMDITVSKSTFAGNGKALTMNEPRGFVKLIKDNETGKIIGGSIIGADASSLISTLTLAITNGLSENEITKTIFAHPTTAEVIHEAAMDFGLGAIHQ